MKTLILSALALCDRAGELIPLSRRFVFCSILASITGLAGQNAGPAPTFKGHVIGESFAAFVADVEGSGAHLTACRSVGTSKEARKLNLDWKVCQILIGASENQMRFEMPLTNDPYNSDRATFDHGRLSQIHFTVKNTVDRNFTYQQVLRDMTTRLGEPTHSYTFDDGAGFADWDRSDVYARVMEMKFYSGPYGLTYSTMDVIVTSHERHASELKAKAAVDSEDTLR